MYLLITLFCLSLVLLIFWLLYFGLYRIGKNKYINSLIRSLTAPCGSFFFKAQTWERY